MKSGAGSSRHHAAIIIRWGPSFRMAAACEALIEYKTAASLAFQPFHVSFAGALIKFESSRVENQIASRDLASNRVARTSLQKAPPTLALPSVPLFATSWHLISSPNKDGPVDNTHTKGEKASGAN